MTILYLPAVLTLSSLISFFICALYLVLSKTRTSEKTAITYAFFATAYGCYSLRLVCQLLIGRGWIFTDYANDIFYIGWVCALWLGVRAYESKRTSHPALWVVPGLLVMWDVIAHGFGISSLLYAIPQHLAGTALFGMTGLAMWRLYRERQNPGSAALAILFWLHGLSTATYPFTRNTWYAPYGFTIYSLISFAIGMGMMLTALIEDRQELLEEITNRKRADEALRRLNRELRAVTLCNEVLLRARDEQALLKDVCRIGCGEAGYHVAWVGYAEDDETRTIRPVAWAGVENGCLTGTNFAWAEEERGAGLAGEAIRSGETVYVQDSETQERVASRRESTVPRNYRSGAALPLKEESGKTFGVLSIYSTEPNVFTQDEIRLLEELAGDLAFGINVLRTRVERKRAEEELRRSYDELELRVQERTEELRRQAELLDLSHEAILVKDLNNRIVFWSRGAEETYGWSKTEALGNVAHNFLKTGFPLSFEDYTSVLMEQGRWDGELVHTTRDGRQITVMSRQALQRDEAGIPTGILEINIDITAERRLEDQLRQSQKLEAIGTLAGGIAHNFNNILASIIGNAELALDEVGEESPAQSNLDAIMRASLRASDHVKEILAFGRKSPTEPRSVHLAPLVQEIFNLLRASLPTTIRMDMHKTTTSDLVFADPSRLQQVLMNLGTNAAHAMPDGGCLEIVLSDAVFESGQVLPDPELTPGNYIVLSIRDTGTGMDETIRRRIFEPFFTTKAVGRGTGLGLAVAYGIVKSFGGAISVESRPGRGSTFNVFLPKATDLPKIAPGTEKTVSGGSGRILFVDDEEQLRLIAEAVLSRLGYKVATEGDPENALRRFRENPNAFDVVITDYTMPGMTGLVLSREILRIEPDMPILLFTGHNDAVDEESAKAAGVREFLMKPFTRRDLAEVVGKVLAGTG